MADENININQGEGAELTYKHILSGNILTRDFIRKNMLFFLFMVGISVVYIYNKYQTETLLINIQKKQIEVKELRDVSVSYASELMSISRESEVIKIVEKKNLNLKELKLPPEKIEIKK